MRLKGKIAIAIGAGQGPGEGMGNGRATALRFAQEGAKVMAVDRNLRSAEETVSMIKQGGGDCVAFEAVVTKEATLAAAIAAAEALGPHRHFCITMSASASPPGMLTLLNFTEEAFAVGRASTRTRWRCRRDGTPAWRTRAGLSRTRSPRVWSKPRSRGPGYEAWSSPHSNDAL
jgi:NAD(P)-dependent dehydrogenase (short-subunit alcohol dehydrogenase family)